MTLRQAKSDKNMIKENTYQHPNEFGYYGKFGGAYIPEMLHRNVEELKNRYLEIMTEASFQKEFHELLHDYAHTVAVATPC